MSVLADDIAFHGCALMPENDSDPVGEDIDLTTKVTFVDVGPAGGVQVVSSAAGDTTQTVTITYRTSAGVKLTEAIALAGLTAQGSVETDVERLLKAVKSATCAGTVAVEAATATRTATAQGGAAKTVSQMAYMTLDASADGSDNVYNGQVLRITAGTGAGQIREIVKYRGSDKRAWVRRDWATPPDNTSVFRISQGMIFEKAPNEIMTVRRAFFDISSDVLGGSARDFYMKIAALNIHATLALTSAQIAESSDPSGKFEFGLEASLDGTGQSSNRVSAPGGITFNSATKNVANSGNHTPGTHQGIWLHLALAAGDAALDTYYELSELGAST